MKNFIRLAIVGYGNLGKGAEKAIGQYQDLELTGIFTRRDPAAVLTSSPVYAESRLPEFAGQIDVCLLCGGSATDLDLQGPKTLELFNTVDSFDTHARIPEYFKKMDEAAQASGHVALISAGWDPGLFSLLRVYEEAALPNGDSITFWGKGVSQGHGDALRRVSGVKNAVQYTVPSEDAKRRFLEGEDVPAKERHRRICFVVLEDGVDPASVSKEIVTMPHYFADYDTEVNFISEEELAANHVGMPHGGSVLRRGETSTGVKQTLEFRLDLDSNPEFTASVLVAAARAAYRLSKAGKTGAFSLLDIAPALLSPRSPEELRRSYL